MTSGLRFAGSVRLCDGDNRSCRHPWGSCPVHPLLSETFGAALFTRRELALTDKACACGFIVHAPTCPTVAKPSGRLFGIPDPIGEIGWNVPPSKPPQTIAGKLDLAEKLWRANKMARWIEDCGGPTIHGPGCGGCNRCLREQFDSTYAAAKQDRSAPPEGWLVRKRDHFDRWHFGPVVAGATFAGCAVGRCSCYAPGGTRPGYLTRHTETRAEAVTAAWAAHDAERAK